MSNTFYWKNGEVVGLVFVGAMWGVIAGYFMSVPVGIVAGVVVFVLVLISARCLAAEEQRRLDRAAATALNPPLEQ